MNSEETETPAETDDAGDQSVLAAVITGAHGVGGNVRLKLIGSSPETTAQSMQAGKVLRAVSPDGAQVRPLRLRSMRRLAGAKGAWTAHFKEVTTRPDAQALYGYSLFIPEAQRAVLPEGEYYVDELLGLPVITDTGHALGALTDVLSTPAHDVYVTESGALIPAVAEFLLHVDRPGGRILVRDVPGLREGT